MFKIEQYAKPFNIGLLKSSKEKLSELAKAYNIKMSEIVKQMIEYKPHKFSGENYIKRYGELLKKDTLYNLKISNFTERQSGDLDIEAFVFSCSKNAVFNAKILRALDNLESEG